MYSLNASMEVAVLVLVSSSGSLGSFLLRGVIGLIVRVFMIMVSLGSLMLLGGLNGDVCTVSINTESVTTGD